MYLQVYNLQLNQPIGNRKMKNLYIIILTTLIFVSSAVAEDTLENTNQNQEHDSRYLIADISDLIPTGEQNNIYGPHSIKDYNFKCGLKPIPPIGCSSNSARCVCSNSYCTWQFDC